ncbi:Lrp/AsnC family transcriptional regulator [Candidatus Woesearchaeota archaeon]|nr:Lrp/AsnC family transcriptional regulator [Candidatus Woesearchaeota archaeon]
MDSKNIKLLTQLRVDSRQKLTVISKKTNIPISTLFDSLKFLKHQIISHSTILLNFSELGFDVKAQIFIKCDPIFRNRLRSHLLLHKSVNNLFKINNGWDFIAETVHRNVRELDYFIESLDVFNIANTEIHYILEDIKREGFNFE